MLWLPLCLLGCECYFAALAGIYSIVHIPVNPVSIGSASLAAAAALILYTFRASARNRAERGINAGTVVQQYYWRKGDIALAGAIGVFAVCFFLYRFCGDYVIAYATNDPADRLSAAMHIVTEQSAVYTWPNLYFGHTSNAMFIEALKPVFPGNLFFRAFEIKDVFNLWLGGVLFHAALRMYSDRGFARVAFFILTVLYVLAFPLNGALFGFSYLGISIELIIFLQITAHMLLKGDVSPMISLLMISFGCFGVGASYTLFAPPAFISAFLVISYYILRVRKTKKDFIPTQLFVFAVPSALVFVYAVLVDPDGQEAIGEQLSNEGAIYFNLFTDVLPYLPLAVYAIWALWKDAESRGRKGLSFDTWVQPLVFLVFQAVFFVRMLLGYTSEYYYAKFNYAAWFFVLLLAGIGAAGFFEKDAIGRTWQCKQQSERQESHEKTRRIERAWHMLTVYAACWALLAVFVLPHAARAAQEDEPLPAILDVLASPYRIYTDNLYRFSDADPYRNHYTAEFVALCGAAYELKQEMGITSFYTNAVEAITDDGSARFWVDALVNERINIQESRMQIEIANLNKSMPPGRYAHIIIVFRNSPGYFHDRELFDSFPKYFENHTGFVIEI